MRCDMRDVFARCIAMPIGKYLCMPCFLAPCPSAPCLFGPELQLRKDPPLRSRSGTLRGASRLAHKTQIYRFPRLTQGASTYRHPKAPGNRCRM